MDLVVVDSYEKFVYFSGVFKLLYVCFKFVRQEAVQIYYIPWPAKKIAAQNSYTNLSAKNSQNLCSLHSQLAKAAKKTNFKKTYCISLITLSTIGGWLY